MPMCTRRPICVVLSLGLLWGGSPRWRHSHIDGNVPHEHTEHDHSEHSHLASHTHGDGHGNGSLVESHAHVHFSLLGMNFTFPEGSDDDDSPHGRVTLLVWAPLALNAVSPSHVDLLAQQTLAIGEPLPLESLFRCIAVDASPLCDTARRDRTGVLLI